MDTIGRIGFWVDDTAYKLCSVKISKNDGSLYIGFSFGTDYVNRGIAGQKITYHPDGNTWRTVQLQEKIVGQKFIDDASTTRIEGLNFSAKGRIYAKGENYEKQPSFDEIEKESLVVQLKNSSEFFNIHSNNDYKSYFAVESKPDKLKLSNMLQGHDYFGIKTRFFLVVNSRRAEFKDAVKYNDSLMSFEYPHPSRSITIFAVIENTTETPKNAS